MTKVSDQIIDRAVELWCRALRRPTKDNGDQSENGFFGMALATINMDHDLKQVSDYDAAIERFRDILSSRLKYARDHEGEEKVWLNRDLRTDYNPERDLADAAKEAGLPASAFSWKSSVSFWSDDYLTSSFGYGAPEENHYPMADGSWLICGLRGRDMPTIIRAVEAGLLPDLHVERAAAATLIEIADALPARTT